MAAVLCTHTHILEVCQGRVSRSCRGIGIDIGVRGMDGGITVGGTLTAEVNSSFRPSVSSRIGMVRMETVDLSSDTTARRD